MLQNINIISIMFFCIIYIIFFNLNIIAADTKYLAQIDTTKVFQKDINLKNTFLDIEDIISIIDKPITIKKLLIKGNKRISDGKIKKLFDIQENNAVDYSTINVGLQKIFESGLFENFWLDFDHQGTLILYVQENPIVNRVIFEGNKIIKSELLQTIIETKSRVVYSVAKIEDDVRAIKTAYRKSGRYSTIVNPVIIKREQNRIDIVFEIEEGVKTRIQSINFVGNKFADDSVLRDEMVTKTNDLFSYIFGGDNYDPDKLSFDTENIRKYYLRHGFTDFRVISVISELNPYFQGFIITITVEEGEQYNFGEIEIQSSIPEVDLLLTQTEALNIMSNNIFDNTQIQKTVLNIEKSVQRQGIPFVRVIPHLKKNVNNNIIDITFVITPGIRRYIESININNNIRTLDYVIRRELTFAEGDPLSLEKIRESEQNLNNLIFFKNVKIIQRQGSYLNNVILDINVEEKSTGSITAGAGLSTSSGSFINFGISERNFLGKGQELAFISTIGKNNRDFDISFTEPYFLDRNLMIKTSIYRTTNNSSSTRKYDFHRSGFGVAFQHQLYRYLSHGIRIQYSNEKISDIKSNASEIVKLQAGDMKRIQIGQSTRYERDNYFIAGDIVYSGFLDDYSSVRGQLEAGYTWYLNENLEFNVNGKIGFLKSLNGKDLKISDNFNLGGRNSFRGFKNGGIGPRIIGTTESLGGKTIAKGSVNLKLPSGLPKHVGVNLVAFTDFGMIKNHGITSNINIIKESSKIRLSVGLGIQFDTLLPINIILAKPLSYEPWDRTENLVISLGATF